MPDLHFYTWTFLAVEWAIRLVMLVYVPQRRSPAAARGWLMLIFVEPVVGLMIYGVFGRPYLPKRRIEMQDRASRFIRTRGREWFNQNVAHPDVSNELKPAIALAKHLGDFGIVGGNDVELLSDYGGSIGRLVDDIAAATRHVHLLYYIFAADKSGRRVSDALIAAAGRGVKCRLLVDGFASRHAVRQIGPAMRAAGVEVVEMLPVSLLRPFRLRFDMRNHRKIAVVDGRIGYVGSQNIVDADFKPGIIYKEMVARVTGPVVLQLQAAFLTDHFIETEDDEYDDGIFVAPPATGATLAQALPSGPGFPYAGNLKLVVALIHAAQHRIVITTPYFIPDASLLQAIQTAALRGVELHLVVSKKADQVLVGLAQRSFYEELLEAGVNIHQYRDGLLHAKHLSIDDDVALVGSSNLDIRSFALNAEITLLIYDREVVRRLQAEQAINIADSDPLTAEAWAARPTTQKIAQNTARLFDSLL
ncbi:MAG: cardiolipin synthase [Pirellulales bacterium]